MSTYNHGSGEGRGFKAGNPGRPKGAKNRRSMQAVEAMAAAGFDPLEEYLKLLVRAEADNNLVLIERCLSRLIGFRYPQVHHSVLTQVDAGDLSITLVDFAELPSKRKPARHVIDQPVRSISPLTLAEKGHFGKGRRS
jgi:hypothetical protein